MDTWKGWKTKAEAVALLGISERTIERMVQAGRIKQAYKRVPNRRPLAVLSPKDLDKVRAETIKPMSAPVPHEDTDGASRALAPRSSPNNASHLLSALASVTPQRVPVASKVFLPLKEASEYSGLPMAYLRRLIGEGTLPALKTGGFRIRRTDLENL
jgi:excisionase family DNA binding protein